MSARGHFLWLGLPELLHDHMYIKYFLVLHTILSLQENTFHWKINSNWIFGTYQTSSEFWWILTRQSLGEFLFLLFFFFFLSSAFCLLVLFTPFTLTKPLLKLFLTFQHGSAWLRLANLILMKVIFDKFTFRWSSS